MKKEFVVLLILLLLLMFFWLCSFILSSVLGKKNVQNPQSNVMSNGIISSLFTVSYTDQTTVLTYSSAASLPTYYSINWNNAANYAGVLAQSRTNCSFSPTSGSINGIIVPRGTPSGIYKEVITIGGFNTSNNYTIRFSLIRIPTVGYITKLCKNVRLKSEQFSPAINNIFTPAVA